MKYTFRISFFLKKSVVQEDGKSPIIARITLNGEKVEFSTQLSLESSKSLNNDLNSLSMPSYKFYYQIFFYN